MRKDIWDNDWNILYELIKDAGAVKPHLHYDSNSVTVLSSTTKIVQLSQERLFTLGAGLNQFFLIFLKNEPNLMW